MGKQINKSGCLHILNGKNITKKNLVKYKGFIIGMFLLSLISTIGSYSIAVAIKVGYMVFPGWIPILIFIGLATPSYKTIVDLRQDLPKYFQSYGILIVLLYGSSLAGFILCISISIVWYGPIKDKPNNYYSFYILLTPAPFCLLSSVLIGFFLLPLRKIKEDISLKHVTVSEVYQPNEYGRNNISDQFSNSEIKSTGLKEEDKITLNGVTYIRLEKARNLLEEIDKKKGLSKDDVEKLTIALLDFEDFIKVNYNGKQQK